MFPEHYFKFIAYNEVESMADVNGAPLPGFGRVCSPSLNPRKRTQQVCCTENKTWEETTRRKRQVAEDFATMLRNTCLQNKRSCDIPFL
ncbi:hypothetical protein Tco_1023977 [Tanacetum coccineum]